MVTLSKAVEANNLYAASNPRGKVCVFLGATAGIGLATLQRLYTILDDSTFYLLGRNESRHTDRLEEIRSSRPGNKLTWIETQAALISSIDTASRQILDTETKVDVLCLSPKGMPFEGHVPTPEGQDNCMVVCYYSRFRLISNLLPLLRKADRPRILSILGGTMERSLDLGDLGCKTWSMLRVMSHSMTMTSLAFDRLAKQEKGMTFIHNTPGLVHTGSPRGGPSTKDGYLRWAALSVAHVGNGGLMWALGDSLDDTGERHAYALTIDYGGPGSLRTDRRNEVCPPNSTLKGYQNDEMYETVWEHTKGVWEEALRGGAEGEGSA